MKFEWEQITSNYHGHYLDERAKVFGGWMVKHTEFNGDYSDDPDFFTVTFIPDPSYSWEIEIETRGDDDVHGLCEE